MRTATKQKAPEQEHLRRAEFDHLPPVEIEGRKYVDYISIGLAYARAVVDGREPCCSYVRKACRRTLTMLERAQNPKEKFYFSPEHVIDACNFYEELPQIEDGMWEKPTYVLEPHVCWEFMHIHGFRRRTNDERLTARAYIEEPRKNWKSGRAAAVCLYELTCSGQLAPQVLIGAASEKQADRVYKPLRAHVDGIEEGNSPHIQFINEVAAELREQFKLESNNTRISCGMNGGFAQRVSSVGEREDGWNPLLILLEELHAQDRDVYEVLRSAFGAKTSALMYMITTAGRMASGLAWDLRKEAIDIIEGRQEDDTYFAAIYTIDPEDMEALKDIGKDTALLRRIVMKANPMWGVSIDPDKILDACREALRSPQMWAEFQRTRLNIWGRSANALVSIEAWEKCQNPDLTMEDCKQFPLWLGVDLASRNDMAALGAVFELPRDVLAVFAEYWIPELSPAFESPKRSGLYRSWVDKGWLVPTPGGLVDFDAIEARVFQLRDEGYDIRGVLCDDMQANQLVNHFIRGGLPSWVFKKNEMNATAATDDLTSRVPTRQVISNNNPILEWNMVNVVGWRSTRGGILPKKHNENSEEKIDGFDAVMQANAGRVLEKESKDEGRPNIYRSRGILGVKVENNGRAS